MKCGACGAIGSSSQTVCEFCGNKLAATAEAAVVSPSGTPVAPLTADPNKFVNYVKDSVNLIQELSRSPSGGFNLAAFFFSVPYLWGFGAKDNAKSVATVLIVPMVAVKVLVWLLGLRIALLALIVQGVWNIYVSWMVSTRSRLLARTDQSYDWGQGILALIVFGVISSILGSYDYLGSY
jgi:hypothetical protein